MALATRDNLIAAMAAGPRYPISRQAIANGVAGRLQSQWRGLGVPTQPAIPGAAAVCTGATPGALAPVATAANGAAWYLTAMHLAGTVYGPLILMDRLAHMGGLSGIVTTAQTVGLTLPARANPRTTVAWLECYTDLGATPSATVTISYTNTDGTAGRTATLIGGIPATLRAGHLLGPFTLQTGDTGILSVQTLTSTTSTATAGSFGVTLGRMLTTATIPVGNLSIDRGYADLGLPNLGADPCLWLAWLATANGAGPTVTGSLGLAEG